MKIKDISNLDELLEKIKNPDIKNAYHYTSLESLCKILQDKKLEFYSLKKMNDEFEKRFFGSCHDLFFCLSKNILTKENFGMWAMYGKLNTKKEVSLENIKNIGVKIFFPSKALKKLCSKNNLELHSVAYTNLVEKDCANDAKKKYTIGSQTTKKEIEFHKNRFDGYLKDIAWQYENEIRLRMKNSNVMKDKESANLDDDIISNLIVYPSPFYTAEDCQKILRENGYIGNINIQENIYRNTICN